MLATCFRTDTQEKAIAIDNDIRGLLRNFGLKVGVVRAAKFEQRIRELVEGLPDLSELMEVLLGPGGSCASSSPSCTGGSCASSSPSCTGNC